MIQEALAQFVDEQLGLKLGADYKNFRTAIIGLNNRNKKLDEAITEKEARISKLEKLVTDLTGELNALSARIKQFEETKERAAEADANAVIAAFNAWAVNPLVPLPAGFSFIAGDFRIRTRQQIIETPDESKWITNRKGSKKYLFPNPNLFNQMTASDFLYTITGTPKAQGLNKICVTKACEMTYDGFVEFTGELQIFP